MKLVFQSALKTLLVNHCIHWLIEVRKVALIVDFHYILYDQKKRKKRLFVLSTQACGPKGTMKSIKVESQS